ncbi:MAG: hypothetical protein CVU54_16030 [Deltaproteobacteria bacterium HGW-Deltaproteobacteria-12]|jgi:hypothetical protein|nr:MAG: hypothetical protein CVU54_16030 [Deltaproteobacteria bacterium HGW-Deltaproteobacteria-12]
MEDNKSVNNRVDQVIPDSPYQPSIPPIGKIIPEQRSETISGDSIMPQTPDAQTIPSGNPGNS